MSVPYCMPYTLCFPKMFSKSMKDGSQCSHTVNLRGPGRGKHQVSILKLGSHGKICGSHSWPLGEPDESAVCLGLHIGTT